MSQTIQISVIKGVDNKPLPKPVILKESCIIGRTDNCDLVLNDVNVSRQHARISVTDEGLLLTDLKSANGTRFNQNLITETKIALGDKFEIGPFLLKITTPQASLIEEASSAIISKDEINASLSTMSEWVKSKLWVHEQLLKRMDLKRMDLADDPEKLKVQTSGYIKDLLEEIKTELPGDMTREQMITELIDEALGLGPLEDLLKDPKVTEIMVNHKDQIFIEKSGRLQLSQKSFINDAQVRAVIERIVAPLGRRIDESTPMVDARLKDGSRVNAIIPPLALKGSCITIRKFSKKPFTIENLIQFGTLNKNMADFIQIAVEQRQNIVISGGTGSGKTTLLNVVSGFIPDDERIVTVEDAAELQLPQVHVVSLETRPPNIEGEGAITIRDLVRNCLRMRPDRIVVGECRGSEALDMLQAMNTGHDGSLTTGHANAPRDMLSRLETMVLMAGMDLPSRAIREQISSAVSLIIQQTRFPDGSRKITHITEVTGMEDLTITMQDIFLYKQTGFTEDGKVKGYYTATGCIPYFIQDLKDRGIKIPMHLFEESPEERP